MTIVKSQPGSRTPAAAALALRLSAALLGVFFVAQGLDKLPWVLDSSILAGQFQDWRQGAAPSVQWYIDTIAVPGVPLFARLVPIAEIGTGIALVIGFWSRLAAALAGAMVVNLHIAQGTIFAWTGLRDPSLLPVVAGLLAILIAGGRLPWSVKD